MENHVSVSILYEDGERKRPNEADLELNDALKGASVDLISLILELNDVILTLNAGNEDKWLLNEYIVFQYVLSGSNSTYESENPLIMKLNKTPALHELVYSNQENNQIIGNPSTTIFVVQARLNWSPMILENPSLNRNCTLVIPLWDQIP